jgi:hypothetical protein
MLKHDLAKQEISISDRIWSGILFYLQHMFKKSAFIEKLRAKNVLKLTSKLLAKRQASGQMQGKEHGSIFSVDRVSNISEVSFIKKYIKTHTPVIFDGAAKEWPCTKKWSLDYLNAEFGDKKFKLITRNGVIDPEELEKGEVDGEFQEEIKVSELVTSIRSGEKNI